MINRRIVLLVFLGAGVAVGCASAPAASRLAEQSLPPGSPVGSAVIPVLTETFSSSTYGYSVGYTDGATIEPATELWSPPDNSGGYDAFDFVTSERIGVFRAASAEAPTGVSIDDWIDESITGAEPGSCNPPRTTLPEISVDGQPGRIREGCPDEIEATVVVDRRVYVFTLFSDSRVAFDALAATIDLRPKEAIALPSPTPS